jgi:hypothetical protein
MLALAGCSSSGSDSTATEPPPATSTVLSGMASKGPIKAGTVKVFAVKNGVVDMTAPIAQGQTDVNGNYSIDLGQYQHAPVVVEVTGGSFTDEVSGATVTLNIPMHTAVANIETGSTTVAVTPITELAFQKAKGGGTLTEAAINMANATVGATFSVNDPVSSLPIPNGTTEDQRNHAAACEAISQLVNSNKGPSETLDECLTRTLVTMGEEEEHGGLSGESITMINTAITTFNNSGTNQTGGNISTVPIPSAGMLKMSSSGASLLIGAIDVTVKLPAGVTVEADPNTGEVTSGGDIKVSGVAAVGNNSLTLAKFTPASGDLHIAMENTAGFGSGEFVTIKFDLAPGTYLPALNAFTVVSVAAKAIDGSALTGVTAAPSSVAGL